MKIRSPFMILRGIATCHAEVRGLWPSLEASSKNRNAPQDDMFCMLCMFLMLFLGACTWNSQDRAIITLRGPQNEIVEVHVEIADDPSERTQGLMFRENLPKGEGMLFVFEGEQPRSFWMKNTLIPLDILFFDAAGGWISSATMTPCTADPCPQYLSAGPATYALEVPFGFTKEYGVDVGWVLSGSF